MLYNELEPVPGGAGSQPGTGEKCREKGRHLRWARHQALRPGTVCCRCPGPSELSLGGPGDRGSVLLGPGPLPPGRGSQAGGSTLRSPLKGMLRGREKRFSTSCSKVLARSLNCFSSRWSPSRIRAAMRKVKVLAEE